MNKSYKKGTGIIGALSRKVKRNQKKLANKRIRKCQNNSFMSVTH